MVKIGMKQNKILLTGFKDSSAEFILDKVSNNYDKFLFTNDYTVIYNEIDELFKSDKYDYVIMFGQKPLLTKLSIELKCKKKKEILKTNFPYEKLISVLEKNNIDYKLSENPGTSYCNFAYYNSLKCLEVREFKGKVIFIHIPFLENFKEMNKVIDLFLERE